MVKALHLAAADGGHEESFMARYERLQKWAMHLCAGDREAAEDLIQEAFVQFTLTGPDLREIDNLDAYLFGLLRILHLSQLRRSKSRAQLLRMALDYDAAALGLRGADPREQLIMREQLQRVCRYACARKETSKAGSVLLLRFFLGYYPAEIARLCVCKRPAVEERLRVARAEAKAYLDDPQFLRAGGADAPAAPCDLAQSADDFLRDLRQRIYQSRRGECLDARAWERLYRDGSALDSATLAHLASCPRCLDIVNELLGLPPLSERHPVDTLGKDTSGKGGGGGDDDGPEGGRGGTEDKVRRYRQRAREVFEHRPEQLCVAVNGYLVGSHRVSGRRSEQTLHVNDAVEFVEVFSEQDVRLLLLQVGEQPPRGPFRHHVRVPLNDGRELETSLSLNYPTSTLQVVYRDSLWQAEGARSLASAESREANGETSRETGSRFVTEDYSAKTQGDETRGLRGAARRLRGLLTDYRFWLRPGVATAVLCLLVLTAALFFVRWHGGTVSAAELLGRSSAAERAAAGDGAFVSRRIFYLESKGGAGEAWLRRRVEVWQSAARGTAVRRVYDERNQLVIAERLEADGARTVLTPGSEPSTRFEPRPAAADLLEDGSSWRLSPSAETFLELTGRAEALRVEEAPETYTVSYRRGAGDVLNGGIVEASLVIRKEDLRGVELRVVVEREGRTREHHLVESLFTKQPASAAPDSIFEVEGPRSVTPSLNPASPRETEAAPPSSSSVNTNGAAPAATAELEVEVNYLLNGISANLGDQVSVRRTPSGRLRVEALTETAERKTEILNALAPVAANPAVEIEVSTVAEALRRRGARPSGVTSVLDIEVREDSQDVDAELRRRFAPRLGDGAAADEGIVQLSRRVLEHSRRAVQYAAALRKTAASFPREKSDSLDAQARAKLLAIVESQVRGYVQSVRSLGQELVPLSPGGVRGGDTAAVSNDAELRSAVERLLQLSRANDEAVRSAFALSAHEQSLARVKSARFWAALAEAETLAQAVERAYRR
jgi:DNA-directed RNA polymerase specialized sigma24 family protein